jgi:anti-sigma-K factor RskA
LKARTRSFKKRVRRSRKKGRLIGLEGTTAGDVLKGHEEYRELLALSALDADDEQRRALDAHLAACDECRAELRGLRDAAAALALANAPVAPSPELRTRLLASLKTTPQESRGGAGSAVTSHRDTGGANVVSLEEARRKRGRTLISSPTFAFGAIAASLILCALAAVSFVLWQRNSSMRTQLASLSTTLSQTQDELAARGVELERARREHDLLASPDARTADLSGTHAADSARARLIYDARTGEAMLTATNLPAAPAGKAYQLWFIADGKPLPGSLFNADAQGRAEMHDRIPTEGRRAQIFAVTLEPASGVQSPTGEMYLKSAS